MQTDLFGQPEPSASSGAPAAANDGEPSAAPFVPADASLEKLREAAAGCEGCDLYRHASQTVFGEGPSHAALMMVGEQPGDVEDRRGRPFVGPAGALLRRSMTEAGLDPNDVYITNAVKHFKFVERGKYRIHSTPKRIEIVACMPWLEAEIRALKPRLIVALGATAGQALFGPSFRVTKARGTVAAASVHERIFATIHPSAILRAEEDVRAQQERDFVGDLKRVGELLAQLEAA